MDLKALFLAYVEAKQAQQVLDYDDLLLYWAQMVSEPELALEIGSRFSHVLVDEYQDTNHLQASLLLAMKPDGRGLTVVGDDAQSIYAFRGATVRNILDFPQQFDPPARQITLERNYRSTQPILAAANEVIALAKERYSKDLWVSGFRPRSRIWSRCGTRSIRRAMWSTRFWPGVKPASSSLRRPCCSVPRRTAFAWKSN